MKSIGRIGIVSILLLISVQISMAINEAPSRLSADNVFSVLAWDGNAKNWQYTISSSDIIKSCEGANITCTVTKDVLGQYIINLLKEFPKANEFYVEFSTEVNYTDNYDTQYTLPVNIRLINYNIYIDTKSLDLPNTPLFVTDIATQKVIGIKILPSAIVLLIIFYFIGKSYNKRR